jgi:hypothetical protein
MFEARETEYIPLVKRSPMALEIDRRELTDRVGHGHVCGAVQARQNDPLDNSRDEEYI